MKKDLLIKIIFIVLILVCIYLIISGLSASDEEVPSNEVLEQGLRLSNTTVNLEMGGEYQVTGVVLPEDATYKNIEWKSSNPGVATVSNGVIRGVGPGTCIVQATTEKARITRVVTVTVNQVIVNVEKIIVTNPNIELFVADTAPIEYTVEPANATSKNISIMSEDPTIVSFTVDRQMVGLKEGETNVVLKSNNGLEEKIHVVVKNRAVDVQSISCSKSSTTITVGSSDTLKINFKPSNATDKALTWTSSDTNIAIVNDGKVTGINSGTVTITAKTTNGKEANCKVKIKAKAYAAITDNSKYHSGFSLVASYNSSTLKYRIQQKNSAEFVLVWVEDPYKQWNSALPQLGKAFSAESLLQHEINTYGYKNKGLVATNASFFWAGWGDSPAIPLLFNKGKVIRDIENKKYPTVYGTFGMTQEGKLKSYSLSGNNYSKNKSTKAEMIKDGIRNNFSYATMPISENGTVSSSNDRNNRTILCQINTNNFIIYSGGSLTFHQIAVELKNTFGCKVAYNLDGGGSRKLYYKTSSSSVKKIFGGSRAIPDMMYFVEQ